MTKLWVKSALALIVGLGLGSYIGVIHASRTIGVGARWVSQWAAGGYYGQLADLQYRYADEAHARAALADFLNFAQQMKDANKVSDPTTFGFDVALTYMKLAILDRRGGDIEGYRSNVSRAQEALKAADVKNTSIESLEKFINLLDDRAPKPR